MKSASPTPFGATEDDKSDDSGIIMELDTTTTSSSSSSSSAPSTATTSATATPCKVSPIRFRNERRRMLSSTPKSSTHNNSTIAMARKLVKKAIKIRQRMENSQHRRQRHIQLLEQLCQDQREEQNNDETKKEDYEEPPPRPPTRRCMFYREDTDVVKVLRAKQF